MLSTPAKTWFTAIPLPYSDSDTRLWTTDGGVLAQAFLKVGVHSRFVTLGEPMERENPPLVVCRPEQMRDPVWWRRWNLDGVVLSSWGAPRFEPIARAIKESGARLIVRMDSDGMRSPRIDFFRYLRSTYAWARATEVRFPAADAVLRTLAFRMTRRAQDTRTCAHLSHADIVVIESPLARQWFVRYLKSLGRADLVSKVRVLPHPAKAELVYDKSIPKTRRIIAVGRWQSYQKDAPRLMRVLTQTLAEESDYSAIAVGEGADLLRRLLTNVPAEIQARIMITGPLEHGELQRIHQAAQILLFTSRYEGFPYTAGEALCCGCTIVGSGTLPFANYIASRGAGTPAVTRSVADLSDALRSEVEAWRCGERNPEQISSWWQNRLAARSIASAMLGFFPS